MLQQVLLTPAQASGLFQQLPTPTERNHRELGVEDVKNSAFFWYFFQPKLDSWLCKIPRFLRIFLNGKNRKTMIFKRVNSVCFLVGA